MQVRFLPRVQLIIMLRPKKKITKKEIQRDPFLESVDQAQAHVEKNRSMYINICISIIVIIIGFTIISDKKEKQKIKASASLAKAFISKDKDDLTTAQFQIETILNDFSDTPSAINAEYFIGKMKYEAGEFVEAKEHLSTYLNKNPKGFLSASASIIIADIYLHANELEKAINIIRNGIKLSQNKKDKRTLELHEAKIEVKIGNDDAAKLIVDRILNDDDLNTWHRIVAQEILGNITS